MEHDPSPGADERFVHQAERIRRTLSESAMPVVALAGSDRPAAERFAGTETFDGTITNVRVAHGDPTNGPWASVDTARWGDLPVDAGPLRWQLEHGMRLAGERFSDVEWTEDDATVLVDGQPVTGRTVRAGDRWWATRCDRDGIEITVTARDWHPATVHLRWVTDLAPLLDGLRTWSPTSTPHEESEPLPADLAGEPHRALVDAALNNQQARSDWMKDGGPAPHLPPYWSALWRAAVRRQVELTDQVEPEAARAVSDIVAQLTTLSGEASWFDDDLRLRRRAITETLLYGTGLGEGVPSQPAHQAWRERQQLLPQRDVPVHAREAVDRRWRDAWTAWASGVTG
ncbi:hypothetical protein [Micromonospora sp. 067-2]|uniref:hypothetical protein n=1 Tax=Micromonospora sp. 067-2 TaxID=2789270 RepID=UPI00397E0343